MQLDFILPYRIVYSFALKNGGYPVKKETTTLTLRVPMSTKVQLEMIANKEQRTVNSLVNKILQDYIDGRKN
jgi:predicted HicB family RNase H-like nuclease